MDHSWHDCTDFTRTFHIAQNIMVNLMSNNEWITDRLPTEEDASNMSGFVWHAMPIGCDEYETVPKHWTQIRKGELWCTAIIPIYRRDKVSYD